MLGDSIYFDVWENDPGMRNGNAHSLVRRLLECRSRSVTKTDCYCDARKVWEELRPQTPVSETSRCSRLNLRLCVVYPFKGVTVNGILTFKLMISE